MDIILAIIFLIPSFPTLLHLQLLSKVALTNAPVLHSWHMASYTCLLDLLACWSRVRLLPIIRDLIMASD